MIMLRAVALAAAFACAPAFAGELSDRLAGDAECVKLADIRPLITHTQEQNSRQFDFVRGFYMAAPPASTALPIGDRAAIITDGQDFGVILIDNDAGETCARFHVTDIGAFLAIIEAVGEGATVKAKDAAGRPL
ncbi:hypothetical protein [Roseiarcus sp.]|uniref:hypothetical protein n=1 Tax=Roseiarcus sp. TaxID=1969460 RepID=UPI003F9AF193